MASADWFRETPAGTIRTCQHALIGYWYTPDLTDSYYRWCASRSYNELCPYDLMKFLDGPT